MVSKLLKTLETRHGTMLALPQDRYITACLETYGELCPGEWRLLEQIIRPGMTVVEIGSNIGAHTVGMARACRPGPLYAFEPQRRVFQILCANLALNDVDNVVARPEACGAQAGAAKIPPLNYSGEGNFGGVSLRPPDEAGETVRVMRLDDLALSACGLIKVDVEGFESEVLTGAVETIARHKPALYVENDRPDRQRALIAQIDAMGYRLWWHTPALAEAVNFKGVSRDIFGVRYLSINMLCLPQERVTQVDLEVIDPADPRLPASLDPARGPVPG